MAIAWPWCRTRRTCSRRCRCRRRGRRARSSPRWQARSAAMRFDCAMRVSSGRPRSAGSARPSGEYRHRRTRARCRRARASASQRDLADGQRDADPVRGPAASAGGRRYAPADRPRGRGRDVLGGDARKRAAELGLDLRQELLEAPASSTYFSRALLRSVRSPYR